MSVIQMNLAITFASAHLSLLFVLNSCPPSQSAHIISNLPRHPHLPIPNPHPHPFPLNLLGAAEKKPLAEKPSPQTSKSLPPQTAKRSQDIDDTPTSATNRLPFGFSVSTPSVSSISLLQKHLSRVSERVSIVDYSALRTTPT